MKNKEQIKKAIDDLRKQSENADIVYMRRNIYDRIETLEWVLEDDKE